MFCVYAQSFDPSKHGAMPPKSVAMPVNHSLPIIQHGIKTSLCVCPETQPHDPTAPQAVQKSQPSLRIIV